MVGADELADEEDEEQFDLDKFVGGLFDIIFCREETAAAAAEVITFKVDCWEFSAPGEFVVFKKRLMKRELDDIRRLWA